MNRQTQCHRIENKNFSNRIMVIYDIKKMRCAWMTTSACILIFRHSISGVVFFMLKLVITYSMKKKKSVFNSNNSAHYSVLLYRTSLT